MRTPFNKFIYIGFLLLGAYQSLFTKDYMQAASSFGIGLAFDPFNTDQKWNDRPTWQKAVLIIHLGLVAALFGFAIGMNDK
jgi:ABC-type branched-subunit amino acid transport system permease subunit